MVPPGSHSPAAFVPPRAEDTGLLHVPSPGREVGHAAHPQAHSSVTSERSSGDPPTGRPVPCTPLKALSRGEKGEEHCAWATEEESHRQLAAGRLQTQVQPGRLGLVSILRMQWSPSTMSGPGVYLVGLTPECFLGKSPQQPRRTKQLHAARLWKWPLALCPVARAEREWPAGS